MDRSEASDEQLMAQTKEGDEAALEVLVKRWSGPLLGFIRYRQGEDPEDLFQETWLRVLRHMDRYDPGRRFSTWLFQIALNLCRDAYRRRGTRPPTTGEAVEAGIETPEAALQETMTMHQLLAMLPVGDREILHLRFVEGFQEREIAEMLSIPVGTVKSRTHHAIGKLRGRAAEP